MNDHTPVINPAQGEWLTPTPVASDGAPLRVATNAEVLTTSNLPLVGASHEIKGVSVVEVTFAFRETRRHQVMLHLNGLTDNHRTDIRPALLHRLGESEWHALTYLLPSDGAWSYRFVSRPSIPHDVGKDRQGWLSIHQDGQADPLNPESLRHPHGKTSSVFRGPTAPTRREIPVMTRKEQPAPDRWCTWSLEDNPELSAHFNPSGSREAPLLVLFDAEQYLTMPILQALAAYQHPLDVVTIDSGSVTQRADVLPQPERVARRLRGVLDALKRHGGRNYSPNDVILSGASFGGLAAAGLVVHHPELACRAIAQSASYWYDPERMADRNDLRPGALTRCVQGKECLPHRQIIVQVGTDEGFMEHQARLFVEAAELACIDVRARQYRGGHDWAWWFHALFDGLDEIFESRTLTGKTEVSHPTSY